MANRFAGGDDTSQRHLRYLIHCGSPESFMAHRLEFQRQGSAVECLRKGYGMGERHQIFPLPTDNPDDIPNQDYQPISDDDQLLRDEQNQVIQDWDVLVQGYGLMNAPIPREIRLDIQEDLPRRNVRWRNLTEIDAEGKWHPEVLEVLELAQNYLLPQARLYRAHFFGFVEPIVGVNGMINERRKREFRFLDHVMDLSRVRGIFSSADVRKMFELDAKGSLFFALPLIAEQLYELPGSFDQSFVLCEVDQLQSRIMFYAPLNTSLMWYRNIMIQQFVMPRNTRWRVQHMIVPTLTNMLFLLCRRFLGYSVLRSQFYIVPDEDQVQYVLTVLHTLTQLAPPVVPLPPA